MVLLAMLILFILTIWMKEDRISALIQTKMFYKRKYLEQREIVVNECLRSGWQGGKGQVHAQVSQPITQIEIIELASKKAKEWWRSPEFLGSGDLELALQSLLFDIVKRDFKAL